MNKNRKIPEAVSITAKALNEVFEMYDALCDKLAKSEQGIFDEEVDITQIMSPIEYSYVNGKIWVLETLLTNWGLMSADEMYQSKLMRKDNDKENG